ncbi:hypothetical protein ACFOTA_15925 [Chitinophaga sp. GCM10012297]|uniref:Uncharacterized protein n=1 Tax=Chitinophaga chungangae TaxID=2821488 RepID=A0ABS3YG93_9BACT|nr:hypothetical protein [Chitinophaga chungangae]MBO9153708.1 hypothetical protein [Chitinophaga chungangae]
MEKGKISSLKELQQQMPRIIEQHGKDPSLTFLALANPLLALEKIGYSFTPEAKEEIAAHVRFGKTGAEQVKTLQQQIFTATGKPFDLRDAAALRQNLSALLSRPDDENAPKPKTKAAAASGPVKLALPQAEIDAILDSVKRPVKVEGGKVTDPLESFNGKHAVITPLLEYRRLEATHPQLAEKSVVEALVKKQDKFPLRNIRFRMNRSNGKTK